MSRKLAVLIFGAVVLLIIRASVFTVGEDKQLIVTRFGEIQQVVTKPGLYFRMPLVTDLHVFEKRWLEWDGEPNQIPTRDKKYIWVNAYARWRIADPELFFKRLRDESSAHSRLDDILDGEIRNAIARHDLIEIVRTTSRPFAKDESEGAGEDQLADGTSFAVRVGRPALMKQVQDKAAKIVPEFGLELADVRIKRVNYTESVQGEVYERMISERQRIAARFRSEGQERKGEIRGRKTLELLEIQSSAYRQGQEIKGKGEAEAAGIYAEAYGRDPDFYRFIKALETVRVAVDSETTLILSTDSQVYRPLTAEP